MENFTYLDAFLLAILTLSILISMMRGFIKETLSLLSWVFSFYLACQCYEWLGSYFASFITQSTLREALSFLAIFISAIMLSGFLTVMLIKVLNLSGFRHVDRLLGFVFGFARGLFIVDLLIILGSVLSLTGYLWWRQSFMVQQLKPQAEWLKKQFPDLKETNFSTAGIKLNKDRRTLLS